MQPDLRGQGGYTDSGRWCGPHAGSSKPPHIDEQIWRSIYSSAEKRGAIRDYLRKLRTGSYEPVGPAAAATTGSLAAAGRKRGKKNTYKSNTTPAGAYKAIACLPLNIVVLEDGPRMIGVMHYASSVMVKMSTFEPSTCSKHMLAMPLLSWINSTFWSFSTLPRCNLRLAPAAILQEPTYTKLIRSCGIQPSWGVRQC